MRCLFCPPFPEVFKAAAQYGAAKGDNCVCPLHSPVHAGTLEPCTDGELAASFHYPGGSAQALRMELWVAHTIAVFTDIVTTLSCLIAG